MGCAASFPQQTEPLETCEDEEDLDDRRRLSAARRGTDTEVIIAPGQLIFGNVPRQQRDGSEQLLYTAEQAQGRRLPFHPSDSLPLLTGECLSSDNGVLKFVGKSVMRSFFSSTFTDTEWERNVFLDDCVPFLRLLARKLGLDFQVSEMRWGIQDVTSSEHKVVKVCREELQRCLRESIGVSFIGILSEKYGYRPFPAVIDQTLLSSLRQQLLCFEDEEAMKAVQLIDEWFELDTNAIPAVFRLQPVHSKIPAYIDKRNDALHAEAQAEWWNQCFEPMQAQLRRAAQAMSSLPTSSIDSGPFEMSVTEQEMREGIVAEATNADKSMCQNAILIRRYIEGIKSDDPVVRFFQDRDHCNQVDVDANSKLASLRDEVLPKYIMKPNLLTYSVPWHENGISPLCPEHVDYLRQQTDALCSLLCQSMLEGAASAPVLNPVEEEALSHLRFLQDKVKSFHGRWSVVDDILSKVSSHQITVISGKSGAGKTSVIAASVQRLLHQDWDQVRQRSEIQADSVKNVCPQFSTKSKPCCIVRFLGTTSDSETATDVMHSICGQLVAVYRHKSLMKTASHRVSKEARMFNMQKGGGDEAPSPIKVDNSTSNVHIEMQQAFENTRTKQLRKLEKKLDRMFEAATTRRESGVSPTLFRFVAKKEFGLRSYQSSANLLSKTKSEQSQEINSQDKKPHLSKEHDPDLLIFSEKLKNADISEKDFFASKFVQTAKERFGEMSRVEFEDLKKAELSKLSRELTEGFKNELFERENMSRLISHEVLREELDKIPTQYDLLEESFGRHLRMAKPSRPLLLVLDSLDQLSDENAGRTLKWLLSHALPSSVKLLVSTLPDDKYKSYPALRSLCSSELTAFVELGNLSENGSQTILENWLRTDNRRLTDVQQATILQAVTGSSTPLHLKLMYSFSKEWTSYDEFDSAQLSTSVTGCIEGLFQSLEARHGQTFVRSVFGLISTAEEGLMASELEDLLSADDKVLAAAFEWWAPPIARLPPLLLTRLLSDLQDYLVFKGSGVFNWFHRQFHEVCALAYAADDTKILWANQLADYFSGVTAETCEPFKHVLRNGKKVLLPANRNFLSQDLVLARDSKGFPTVYNSRKLLELPNAYKKACRWDHLLGLVTDLSWVEAACSKDMVQDLLQDMMEYVQCAGGEPMDESLIEMQRLVASRGYAFSRYPQLLLQSAANSNPGSHLYRESIRYQRIRSAGRQAPILRLNSAQSSANLLQATYTVLAAHRGSVTDLQWSIDDSILLSASADNSVHIVSMKSRASEGTFNGHSSLDNDVGMGITSICMTHCEEGTSSAVTAISSDDNGNLLWWNVTEQAIMHKYKYDSLHASSIGISFVECVIPEPFAEECIMVAMGNASTTRGHGTRPSQIMSTQRELYADSHLDLFDSKGKFLRTLMTYCSSTDSVLDIDGTTGRCVIFQNGRSSVIDSFGKLLVEAESETEGTCTVWWMFVGQSSDAVAETSKHLSHAETHSFVLRSLITRQVMACLYCPEPLICEPLSGFRPFSCSKSGEKIAWASGSGNHAFVWHVPDHDPSSTSIPDIHPSLVVEFHTQPILALEWSNSGQYLASGSDDNKLLVWDCEHDVNNKAKHDFQLRVSMHVSDCGKLAATIVHPATLEIFWVQEGVSQSGQEIHKEHISSNTIASRMHLDIEWSQAVYVSPDHKYVATGGAGGQLILALPSDESGEVWTLIRPEGASLPNQAGILAVGGSSTFVVFGGMCSKILVVSATSWNLIQAFDMNTGISKEPCANCWWTTAILAVSTNAILAGGITGSLFLLWDVDGDNDQGSFPQGMEGCDKLPSLICSEHTLFQRVYRKQLFESDGYAVTCIEADNDSFLEDSMLIAIGTALGIVTGVEIGLSNASVNFLGSEDVSDFSVSSASVAVDNNRHHLLAYVQHSRSVFVLDSNTGEVLSSHFLAMARTVSSFAWLPEASALLFDSAGGRMIIDLENFGDPGEDGEFEGLLADRIAFQMEPVNYRSCEAGNEEVLTCKSDSANNQEYEWSDVDLGDMVIGLAYEPFWKRRSLQNFSIQTSNSGITNDQFVWEHVVEPNGACGLSFQALCQQGTWEVQFVLLTPGCKKFVFFAGDEILSPVTKIGNSVALTSGDHQLMDGGMTYEIDCSLKFTVRLPDAKVMLGFEEDLSHKDSDKTSSVGVQLQSIRFRALFEATECVSE